MKKKLLLILLTTLGFGVSHAATASSATKPTSTKKHSKKKTSRTKSKSRKKTNYMDGVASYYGGRDGFDNRQMADGNIFKSTNPHLSAHPTLPLGTKLKVTNMSNGRSIYVTVTDRMPKHGRVIDLSKGAATRLGMLNRGIARVHLEVISDDEYAEKYNTIEIQEGDYYGGDDFNDDDE